MTVLILPHGNVGLALGVSKVLTTFGEGKAKSLKLNVGTKVAAAQEIKAALKMRRGQLGCVQVECKCVTGEAVRDGVDKEFAARLHRQRKLAGLTQEELGKKLEVSHQAVRAWEQGHLPRCRRWAEVAKCLSTTVEELFLGVRVTALNPTDSEAFAARAPTDKSLARADTETMRVRESVDAGGSRRPREKTQEATGRPNLLAGAQRQGRLAGVSGAGEQRAEGFGQRLRAFRRSRGYSIAELAARLGITWHAIQIWEKGESLPQPELWGPIAAMLGTTVPELLHGLAARANASSEATDAERIARLVVAFAACDRPDQDLLIHQAERLMQRD